MKKLVRENNSLLERVINIYIIFLIFYPLIIDKTGYFHILECKWTTYVIVTSIFIIISLMIITYRCFKYKEFNK